MPVKVAKLFKDVKFQQLSEVTKLFYIYLVTNPNLNVVGVLSLNLEVVCLELSCDIKDVREASIRLRELGYLHIKKVDGIIYFVIPEHFESMPKSDAVINKVNKTLKELPTEIKALLSSLDIKVSSKVTKFVRPTPEEVVEYALSIGYLIDGSEFVNYYNEVSESKGKRDIWVDARGKQIRDWKAKLKRVWCKEERKIKGLPNAPKGFEQFHIIKDGKVLTPDGWKGGKPYSKSLALDIELKREFSKLNN